MTDVLGRRAPRLLVILNVFDPDIAGGAGVYTDLCISLVERGYEVTVAAPYPFFPEWRDKSGRNGLRVWRYDLAGIDVRRYGLFIPINPNSLVQRLLFEGSFFCSVLRALPVARRVDAVMAFCPLNSGVAAAGIMKWFTGKPLWLNVQDIAADAAEAADIGRSAWIGRLLHAVESWMFNQADVWSTISPVMATRLREFRRRGQPLLELPNWVGAALEQQIRRQPDKLGRPRNAPVRLLYAGNIGGKQDLLEFCQVLHRSDASFRMRIHGDGARAGEVRDWVARTGDARFTVAELLDERGFAEALHWTDYYVITERRGVGGSFIPSKLLPGVMSGCALLTVSDRESPLGEELSVSDAGPWFSWDRVDEVPALLAGTTADDDRFRQWQANALHRALAFDRLRIIESFDQGLRSMAAGRLPPEPRPRHLAPTVAR